MLHIGIKLQSHIVEKWTTESFFFSVIPLHILLLQLLLLFFSEYYSPASPSFATDAGRSSLKCFSEPDPTGQLSSKTPTLRD